MVHFFPLRSCGLNNHNRQGEAFPLRQSPSLTGNYSSACLITMEINFIQIAKKYTGSRLLVLHIYTSQLTLPALLGNLAGPVSGLLGTWKSRGFHPLAARPCCTSPAHRAACCFWATHAEEKINWPLWQDTA